MALGIVLGVAGVFPVTAITFDLDRACAYLLIAFLVLPVFVPLAVIVIAWLTISGFASIWCAWAAVSSAAITLHLRFAKPDPQPAGIWLAG